MNAPVRDTSADLRFDPFHDPTLTNPFPYYAVLRRAGGVVFDDGLGMWLLGTHRLVRQVLHDTQNFSATEATAPLFEFTPEAKQVLSDGGWRHQSVFSSDGAYHARFRNAVRQTFTPRRVSELEPLIRASVTADAERISRRGGADLVDEIFYRMPAMVILRLLGFDDDDWQQIKVGAFHRSRMTMSQLTPDDQLVHAHGLVESWAFARRLVERRIEHPEEDLTSALITSGEPFSIDELTSLLLTFFSAGHETTTSLLSNAFFHMLDQRQPWEVICSDPSAIASAVDEAIRFDTSLHVWRRRAVNDVDVEGHRIRKGDVVALLLGSANHDETIFPDPDRFDVARDNAHEHLSFGHGLHYCLGAPLAKIEIRTAMEILSARFPSMRLADSSAARYQSNLSLRMPYELNVVWDA